jgi:excisionase family DNA binding protein
LNYRHYNTIYVTATLLGLSVPTLLTTAAAAVRLGISLRSFQRMLASDDPPPIERLGAAVRFHPDDLDEWIDARRQRRAASRPASPASDTAP